MSREISVRFYDVTMPLFYFKKNRYKNGLNVLGKKFLTKKDEKRDLTAPFCFFMR